MTREELIALRANCHATFNGGHEGEAERRAFHHGMDTVCNVLEKALSSAPALPACDCGITHDELQHQPNCATVNEPALPAEVVICAAIKLSDGRIIRGHRHGDCLRRAGAMPGVDPRLAVQGFMTSRNRFVDRVEGLDIQLAAGIPSAALKYGRDYGTQLFSEDVY